LKESIQRKQALLLTLLAQRISTFDALHALLEEALVDHPPLRASEGGLFKTGYNTALDELLSLRHSSHEWLMNYQNKLREETGIKTLKVGFTRMFGYYIEISKAQAANAPASFMRRQTLVNGERFLTSELKEFEDKIVSADERILALEEELFTSLKSTVSTFLDQVIATARAIAEGDALLALARVAKNNSYIRPTVDTSNVIEIEAGRHPVIEARSFGRPASKHFVPNDLVLHGDKKNLIILTGPNMAGKSTYIRQVALIVILAQMGSFVPAKRCRVGIVDKIFSRIGASDDIARGQSTFMVEMAETASILHQATDRSLVILDEIGRGTSTYDGISIAWAVAEYLLNQEGKRAKTLFATHYYELTDLEKSNPRATNASVAVAESGTQVRFLHKIVPGKTDKSYGIHVAEIAGLPQMVIKRAKILLAELEDKRHGHRSQLELFSCKPAQEKAVPSATPQEKEALASLRALDINSMTPLECINTLSAIIKKIS
jgi:DNA mismatch repair protein MutS